MLNFKQNIITLFHYQIITQNMSAQVGFQSKILSIKSSIQNSFRFNLRFISHVQFLSCFLMVLFSVLYHIDMFGVGRFGFSIILFFLAIVYLRGTFSGIIPWRDY